MKNAVQFISDSLQFNNFVEANARLSEYNGLLEEKKKECTTANLFLTTQKNGLENVRQLIQKNTEEILQKKDSLGKSQKDLTIIEVLSNSSSAEQDKKNTRSIIESLVTQTQWRHVKKKLDDTILKQLGNQLRKVETDQDKIQVVHQFYTSKLEDEIAAGEKILNDQAAIKQGKQLLEGELKTLEAKQLQMNNESSSLASIITEKETVLQQLSLAKDSLIADIKNIQDMMHYCRELSGEGYNVADTDMS